MNAHRVDVLDETYGDHVAFAVADNLKLKLFPAENGFLNQNLSDKACLKASGADRLQLFFVIYKTAAGTAHRVGRTENNRISESVGNLKRFLNAVGYFTSGHLDAELVHRVLELDTVLTALDGIHLYADDFYVVFV